MRRGRVYMSLDTCPPGLKEFEEIGTRRGLVLKTNFKFLPGIETEKKNILQSVDCAGWPR